MVKIDTLEGTLGDFHFHYDVGNDVLYVRLDAYRGKPVVGEATDDEVDLMYSEDDGKLVGLDIAGWWQRFGEGPLPDSMSRIVERIEPLVRRIAA